MNFHLNIETYVLVSSIILSTLGVIFILRINWKAYGFLYIISAIIGEILCYIFIKIGFYSFPYRLFPGFSPMPFFEILTVFPFLVLLGVRYSPSSWPWKISFYWVLVHLGMLAETWAQIKTDIIYYQKFWDVWDSYTWWWIYLLIFELVGGLIIPQQIRKPINQEILRYGKIGWFLVHFVLISTIFLAGFYTGRVTLK